MIHFTNITKRYGGQVLYQNASFQLNEGDRVGVVGPNGAGKSTLFKILMDEEGHDTGEVSIPSRTVMGYFSQNVAEMKGRSALEEVMAGAGVVSELAKEMAILEEKLQRTGEDALPEDELMKTVERYGEVQMEFQAREGYDLESRSKEILTGLGIGPELFHRSTDTFSGGWKMRIELAKVLALNPDVLLMDEPTNHLDLETIVWLEDWIKNFKGTLMLISHDREFMNRLVDRILEVGGKTITNYSGNYDFYLREREIRRQQLIAAHSKQQDMLAKEEEFIARFAARASHAAQVQSRVKKLEKIERIEIPPEEKQVKFEFNVPPRSGNDVVKFRNLAKVYSTDHGEKTVFRNISGHVSRLDKIAVIGVNGAGKSTLLKIIQGAVEPTEGDCTIGASVKMGYFSQTSLEVLNADKTIYDEVHTRIPNATLGFVRNLLAAFLFRGDDIYKKISVLSGGEKTRLVLATLLVNPLNFLILDEPTNHLDLQSREVLLEALKNFDGTVLFVSHDRFFLREVATKVFEIHQGELRTYPGKYEEYLEHSRVLHHG